jgi:hypothetical protein
MSLRQLVFFGLLSLVAMRGFGASDTIVVEEGTVLGADFFRMIRDGSFDKTIVLDASQAVFPNDEVPDGAFYHCGFMTGIKLPSTIKRIGIKAFERTGLQSIELPADLEVIEVRAFYACRNLAGKLHLPAKLRRIGLSYYSTIDGLYQETPIDGQLYGAFEGCMMLDTLILHTIVLDTIGAMSFGYCTNLKGQIVLDQIKHIGSGAFTHTLLSRVEIGGLRYVGGYKPVLSHFEGAFEYCTQLKSPYVEDDDRVYTSAVFEPHAFAHIHSQAGGITLVMAKTEGSYSGITDSDDHVNLLAAHYLTLNTPNTLISSIQALNSPAPIGRLSLIGMVNVDELAGLKAAVPQLRSLVMENVLLNNLSRNAFTSGSALRRIVFPSTLKSISASALDGTPLSGILRLPPSLVSIEDAENGKGFLENNTGVTHITLPPTQPNGKDSTGFNLRKIGDCSFINMRGLLDSARFKPNYWVSMASNAFVGSKVAIDYFEINKDSVKLINPKDITLSKDDTEAQLILKVQPYYFTGHLSLELIDAATKKQPLHIKIDSARCTMDRDPETNTVTFSYPLLILNNTKTYTVNYNFLYQTSGKPDVLASGSLSFKYIKAESISLVVEGQGMEPDVTVEVGEVFNIRAIVSPADITSPQINWNVTGDDWVTQPSYFKPDDFSKPDPNEVLVITEGNTLVFSRKAKITSYDATAHVSVTTPDGSAGALLTVRTNPPSLDNLSLRATTGQKEVGLFEAGHTLELEVSVPNLSSEELPPVTWSIIRADRSTPEPSYAGIFISEDNSRRKIWIPAAMPDTSFRVSVTITTTNTKGVQQSKTAYFLVRVITKLDTISLATPEGETERSFEQDEVFTVVATVKPADASIDELEWSPIDVDVLERVGDKDSVARDLERNVLTYARKYKVLRRDKGAVIRIIAKIGDEEHTGEFKVKSSAAEGYPYSFWLEKVMDDSRERLNDHVLTLTYGQSITLRAGMFPEGLQEPQWSFSSQEAITLTQSSDGTIAVIQTKPQRSLEAAFVYLTVSVKSGPNSMLQHMQAIRIVHNPITNLYLSAVSDIPVTGIGETDYDERFSGVGLLANLEPAVGATYPSYRWSIYPEEYARFTTGTDVNDRTQEHRYIEPLIPNREFTVSIRPVTDTSVVKGYSYTIRTSRAKHRGIIRFEEPDTIYMERGEERDLIVLSSLPAELNDKDVTVADFYPLTWRLTNPATAYFVGRPKAEIIDTTPVRYIKYTHRIHTFLSDSATRVIVRDSMQRTVGGDTLFLSTHALPPKEGVNEIIPVEEPPSEVAVQHIAILAGGKELDDLCLEPEVTVELQAALSPQEATYTGVQWVVEDPSVALIVKDGSLRVLSEGASCSLMVLRHDASTRVFAVSLDAAASTVLLTDTLTIRTTTAPLPPEEPQPDPAPDPVPEDPVPDPAPDVPESPVAPEDPAPEDPESPEDPAPGPDPAQPAAPVFSYTIYPDKEIVELGDTITVSVGINPPGDLLIEWTLFPSFSAHFLSSVPANPFSRTFRVDAANTAIALSLSTDTVFTFVVAPYVPEPETPPLIPQLPAIPQLPDPPLANAMPVPAEVIPAVDYYAQTLRISNLEGYSVRFSGISGRIFFSENSLPSSDEYRYLPLPAGVYILSASKDGHCETIKFVVK